MSCIPGTLYILFRAGSDDRRQEPVVDRGLRVGDEAGVCALAPVQGVEPLDRRVYVVLDRPPLCCPRAPAAGVSRLLRRLPPHKRKQGKQIIGKCLPSVPRRLRTPRIGVRPSGRETAVKRAPGVSWDGGRPGTLHSPARRARDHFLSPAWALLPWRASRALRRSLAMAVSFPGSDSTCTLSDGATTAPPLRSSMPK